MTDENAIPDRDLRDPLVAAVEDLSRVRELLITAGRGEVSASVVRASLQEYWHAHRSTLRAAAVSVGEELRRQSLAELYKWRAQLDAQLKDAREVTGEPPVMGGPKVPPRDDNANTTGTP